MNIQVIKAYKKVLNAESRPAESNCSRSDGKQHSEYARSLGKRRQNYARGELRAAIKEHYPNLDQNGYIKLFTDLQEISKD